VSRGADQPAFSPHAAGLLSQMMADGSGVRVRPSVRSWLGLGTWGPARGWG